MTIHKYSIEISDDIQSIEMPYDAQILCCKQQHDTDMRHLQIWALVDQKTTYFQTRSFIVIGTGHHVKKRLSKYIDTVITMHGALVWHVFEV